MKNFYWSLSPSAPGGERFWVLLITLLISACRLNAPVDSGHQTPATAFAAATAPSATSAAAALDGRIFYVSNADPYASDANNGLFPSFQGDLDGPWRTIQKAARTMLPGDATYVREGIYHVAGITFAHSGQAGAPVTLARYESEEVILDGENLGEDGSPGILLTEGQGYFVFEGLTIRHMPWSGLATDPAIREPYPGIVIRDSVFYGNGWSGLDLAGVDGFLVEGVEAYENRFYGLNIAASEDGAVSSANGIVRNSLFHNQTGDEGHGLAVNQGHDILVSDNVSYHNRIHGFDVSDWPKGGAVSHDITFARNFSYDNGKVGFAINSDSHHVLYQQNVAWQNGADWAFDYSQPGFMCYEGCWHVEWLNNVALENSGAGFWVEDQRGRYSEEPPGDNLLVFKNNIAFNNGRSSWPVRPALVIQGGNTAFWQVMASHNNLGGLPGPVVGINVPAGDWPYLFGDDGEFTTEEINRDAFQTGNVSVDPLFVDAVTADIRLRPTSSMIDAGTDVGLPFCGKAPDMGAVEFCP